MLYFGVDLSLGKKPNKHVNPIVTFLSLFTGLVLLSKRYILAGKLTYVFCNVLLMTLKFIMYDSC